MGRSPDNLLSGITFRLIQLPIVKDTKACEDRLVLAGFFYGHTHMISSCPFHFIQCAHSLYCPHSQNSFYSLAILISIQVL